MSNLDEAPPYAAQYHTCQVFLSADVEKQGWLKKQGGSTGQWRKRWFVLSQVRPMPAPRAPCGRDGRPAGPAQNYLFYFRSAHDSEPRGCIPLEEVNAHKAQGSEGVFLVEHPLNFSYYLMCEDGDGLPRAASPHPHPTLHTQIPPSRFFGGGQFPWAVVA